MRMRSSGWWRATRYSLAFVGLSLPARAVHAQATPDSLAALGGRVVDSSRGIPLNGATLQVVGTSHRAVSDAEGQFLLVGLVPGSAMLEVHAIGYKPTTRRVVLRAADTVRVNIGMEREAVVLETVRSQARPPERDRFETQPDVGT